MEGEAKIEEIGVEGLFFGFLDGHGRQEISDGMKEVLERRPEKTKDTKSKSGDAGAFLDRILQVGHFTTESGWAVAVYGAESQAMGGVAQRTVTVLASREGGDFEQYKGAFTSFRGVTLQFFFDRRLNGKLHDGPTGAAAFRRYMSASIECGGAGDKKKHFFYLRERAHYSRGERWDPSPEVPACEFYFPEQTVESCHFYAQDKPRGGGEPSALGFYPTGRIKWKRWFDPEGKLHREDGAALEEYQENGQLNNARYYRHGDMGEVNRAPRKLKKEGREWAAQKNGRREID